MIRPDRAGCGILVHGTRAAAVAALDPAVARLHRERRLDVKVRDVDARALEEFKALAAAVERVVVDVGDAALLDEERAVDAGTVRDEDGGALAGVAVLRELRDGVELGVLHFGTGHETAVHLHFAAVVVARGHTVPAERDDGVVLDDHAAHLEAAGIASLGGEKRDLHVHAVVFLDVHRIAAREHPTSVG